MKYLDVNLINISAKFMIYVYVITSHELIFGFPFSRSDEIFVVTALYIFTAYY